MADEYRSVLVKTYEMVNDPSTDSTISWSKRGNSFIVWDHQKLSKYVLPRVFGYNFFPVVYGYDRFSYFIDLLCDGHDFEKIINSPHQYEYAQNHFVKDKPELILNMYTPEILNMYTPEIAKMVDTKVKKMMMVKSRIRKKRRASSSSVVDNKFGMKDRAFSCLADTYDMVDDPWSDSVVSWRSSGKSFIIWDPDEFAKVILPRFLLHDDFYSFTRMLAFLGFRKVDSERWEFEHEDFVRGKPLLVKNIEKQKETQKILRVSVSTRGKRISKRNKRMSKVAVDALKEMMNGLQI